MRTASESNLMRLFYSVTSNKLAWKPIDFSYFAFVLGSAKHLEKVQGDEIPEMSMDSSEGAGASRGE